MVETTGRVWELSTNSNALQHAASHANHLNVCRTPDHRLQSTVSATPAASTPASVPLYQASLLRALHRGSAPLDVRETEAIVAQATNMLLHAHAVGTSDLVLALSSLAALSACSCLHSKDRPLPPPGLQFLSPDTDADRRRASESCAPVMLPFIPLLAAVACRDLAGVEAALRRLNRRLACPLSCSLDAPGGGAGSGSLLSMSVSASLSASGNWADALGAAVPEGLGGSSRSGICRHGNSEGDGSVYCAAPSSSGCLNARSLRAGRGERADPAVIAAVGPACGEEEDCGASQSARSAASSSMSSRTAMSSLLAVRQAEAQMVNEQERCRAAAVRLCGRSAQLYAAAQQQQQQQRPAGTPMSLSLVAGEMEAEAEAVRGACVAALATAAADVRCHRTLLGSPALDALGQLLRGPGTAAHAATLVHNLAAPPSASFRDQLRRRGVLGPLLDYVARLTAVPPSTSLPSQSRLFHSPGPAPASPAAGSPTLLRDLTVALTALACLSAGQEGAEALRQPQLRAHRRLLALQARLADVCGAGGGGRGSSNGGGAERLPDEAAVGAAAAAGCGGRDSEGGGQAAAQADKVHALVRRLLRAVGVSAAPPAVALADRAGSAVGSGATGGAAPAGALQRAPAQAEPQGSFAAGVLAAAEPLVSRGLPGQDAAGADGASMSFQSQVMVDGRPLQLTSVITRTSARRPDGTLDVRYHFQDQVSPGPESGPLLGPPTNTSTNPGYTAAALRSPAPAFTPPPPPARCYRTSSTWVHADAPPADAPVTAWAAAASGVRAAVAVAEPEPATPVWDSRQQLDQDLLQPHESPWWRVAGQQHESPWDLGASQAVADRKQKYQQSEVAASPAGYPASGAGPTGSRIEAGIHARSELRPRSSPAAPSPLAALAEHAGRYLSLASTQQRLQHD